MIHSDPALGNTSRCAQRTIHDCLCIPPPHVSESPSSHNIEKSVGKDWPCLVKIGDGNFTGFRFQPLLHIASKRSQSDEQEGTNRLNALLVLHIHHKWPTTTRLKGNSPSTLTPPKGSSLDSNRSSSSSTPGTSPSTTPHSSHMATSNSSSRPSMRDTAGKQCPCLHLLRWERP